MRFEKRDAVLWPRHLRDRPALLRALRAASDAAPAVMLVDGVPVSFAPMKEATGFKAVGANRERWNGLPYGAVVELSPTADPGEPGPVTAPEPVRSAGHPWPPPVRRRLAVPTAFDDYVVVDWSANAAPKTGRDSIWWCVAGWEGPELRWQRPANPPTRRQAEAQLRDALLARVRARRSVLVGFDFSYGYPAGVAAGLGLEPSWRAIWRDLRRRIVDEQETRERNNRFEVAAEFNRRLGGAAPFWGAPEAATGPHLSARKPPPPWPVAEFRLAERVVRGPKSAFQLQGAGSVGGQVLMGLPTLERLRDDPELAAASTVWPFETGPALPPRREGDGRIVHAEVYPSLYTHGAPASWINDEAQVLALAGLFASLDGAGRIAPLFAAPARLAAEDLARVVAEEGWILGVG
jgi:precorrin-8X/cobalt-precorrin-8 methylmutase